MGWGSNSEASNGLGFGSRGHGWLGSGRSDRLGFGRGGPRAEHPSASRPAARPTWRVERRQLAGSGVLCSPAPALRRLVLVQLRLPARRVLGARHGPSPGPARCALLAAAAAAEPRRDHAAQ